jgi:hypothetical protein
MRLLICGSRDWTNKEIIKKELLQLLQFFVIEVIIHGGCRGADILAGQVAKELNIPVQEYLADWNTHGKSAGPKRNQKMLDVGKPTFVFAFHDDIDESKGTKDMITRTIKANIPFKVIREIYKGDSLEP